MRYEDASGTFQASGPIANDDSDTLTAGSRGPATGNLITGEGTQYGSAGADSAAGAHVTAIAGKGGEDSSFAGGKLSVGGEFGQLSVDAEGNYSYLANTGAPENVRDRFVYTLADNQGNSDTAALIVEIGKTPVVIKADAQQIVPGPDGVVTLPPGVELSDIMVVGRNLVINMPDGTQLIIVDGAIFVPQLVLGGVEVPATNVAALLIGQEVQPAAGETPPSGGGNFALPPPPLDPGIPLGDLIPPTEYNYIPPEPQEVFDILDEEPEAGAAFADLDDDAQPDGNPGGVGDDPGTDIANGSLPGSGGDGDLTWDLLPEGTLPNGTFSFQDQGNGDVWILQNGIHVLTVSVDPSTGAYTVTQVAAIDHPAGGDENNLDFTINYTVTDEDGDVANGTLTVNVDDDTPIAVPDPEQITGLVDEDDLPDGNNDNALGDDDPGDADGDGDGTTTAGAAGSLSGLFSFGADQPGSIGLGTDTSGMTAQGLTSNGVALTYAVVGDTLTASAGGTPIFTLTVHADGSWEFDLEGQLDHPEVDIEDDLDIDFSSMIVGTDHDSDTASLPDDTFVITVDDDLPVPAGERQQVTGLVDEDDLPDGNNDDALGDDDPGDADGDGDGTTTGGDDGSLLSLFSFGADQPGTVELSSDTSGLPALTSNNVPVTYAVNGNVLTASANGTTVFTLTVDADGSWVFDLEGQLDHPEAGIEDNLDLDFSSIIIGVDADGDTATLPPESFVVDVDDDMPQEFEECPDEVITVNDPDADPFTGSLNLPPVGADDPGVVTFGVEDGDPVLDTGGQPVTSGEDPLYYFINDDGVLEARVGNDPNGELIFTITLNGDGTFTYDQIGQIGIGGTISFDNFDEADAGNTNYLGLGNDDPNTDVDLLMSAGEDTDGDPDIEDTTVNTDNDSIGAQNQSMDANDSEVLRLDFVSNLQTGGAGPTGFTFDGHVATNSYLQLVPQVQGSQDELAEFKVWALNSTLTDADAPDRNPTDGFSDATPVTITEVTIIDYLTGATHTEDISALADGATEVLAFGVSVTRNSDGSVTFSGIQEGDQYGVATGANDFNAIAVQATDHSFDLGVFSIGIANEFEPVDLQVPIILTDSDGDPVECDIDIHIGVPLDVRDISVTVNEAGLDLVGSDPGSDSETQSGALAPLVSGGTGPFTFELLSDPNGQYGNLILDETTGEFTYTLDTPFDSQPDADDGTNPELGAESFEVRVTDSLGATQTLTITINIIDDVPTAEDDFGSQENEGDPITVDVLANDTEGADGVDEDNDPAVKVELVDGTLTGTGNLVYNDDGTFTYTPSAGEEGTITFDYQITDNDGDTSVATVTINLEDDSEPQIGTPENLEVDEDGFAFANDDAAPLQSDPSETDHDENLTDSGDVVVDFGNDVPDAPLVDSIELLDDASYDGQLTDLDGNPVTFALNGSGQLVGTANSVQVMIISISGAVAGPGAGEVTYTYSAQLLQPVMHADEGNTENDALLSGIQFQVTDSDGDPASSSFDVTVWDDVPSATDEPQQDVAEDASISGTFDFVEGADGAGVTHINGIELNFGGDDWSQWIPVEDGQIRAQADGSYEFEPDGSASGVTSGTFTVTDGDGDEVVADWAFNITDAGTPTAGTSAARLDDDGLAGGNPLSVTNDIDANVGERAGEENPEEDIFNGQLTLNFGSDGAGSVTFAAMDGETRSVGTETVLLEWDGVDTLTATINDGGPRDGTLLFDIVLDTTTGEYTLTLRDNVIHAAGGNETSAPNLALTYTVIDSDNSPVGGVDGTLNITFNDDAPTLTNVQPGASVDVDETDGFPTSDISATAVITATQAFGADGAAAANSVVYGLAIVGGSPEPSGLETTVGGHDITLVQIDSNTIQGQYNGTNVAFTIDIGSDGRVTLTQNVALNHSDDGGPAPTDHNDTLDLTGLVNATITITDGDGDTATASAPIGDNLVFYDDGPDSEVDAQVTVPTLTLDESPEEDPEVDEGGDFDPAGLSTVTVGFAGNFQAADYGADGAGTTAYALVLAADGAASGLYALDNSDTDPGTEVGSDEDGYGQGEEILLYDNAGVIEGRVGTDVYFTISVNSDGEVTFTQLMNVWHADMADDDDTSALSAVAETLMLEQTVTDGDGDFDTSAIDLSDGVFFIEDDGPEIIAFEDATGDNTGATPSAEGVFEFDIGTDGPNGDNDDIFVDPESIVIRINGIALDPEDNNIVFTPDVDANGDPAPEDANFAYYRFTFEYANGPDSTAQATGTLVFDKANGTYTVTLTSGPIEGFTTLETEAGSAFVGYALNTNPAGADVLDDTQPQVAVTTILEETIEGDDGFYVQFTGFGAGNGGHETIDYDPVDPAPADGDLTTWTEGELFSEGTGTNALWNSWVSVSGNANGVGGDQTNGPDALNFDLYSSNPGGTVGGLPTASASDMFLHFDTIGDGHDMVVVLKLWQDTDGIEGISAGDTFTTKALVIQGSDIYQFDANSEAATVAALTGTKWESVVTEIVNENGNNNDGLVIIESNDYDPDGDGWQIIGAQIVNAAVTSDDFVVTGDGINYNNAVGDTGESTAVQDVSVVTDTNPLKIMNIGFLTGSTTDQSFEIDFDVTITDADGDTETASLTATIGDPPVETLTATTMETSIVAANDDSSSFSSLAYSTNDNTRWSGSDKGFGSVGNTGIVAGMVAAAGMQSIGTYGSDSSFDQSFDLSGDQSFQTSGLQLVDQQSFDGSFSSQLQGLNQSEMIFDLGRFQKSNVNFDDLGETGGLLGGHAQAAVMPAYEPAFATDQASLLSSSAMASPVAPAVGMVSAEMLMAAGLLGEAGGVQHGGAVEMVLADTLGQGAPTVDGLLAHLSGGIGDLAAISNVASPAAGDVPGWDMAMLGGSGFGADMLTKLDASMLQHHDAVQPIANG